MDSLVRKTAHKGNAFFSFVQTWRRVFSFFSFFAGVTRLFFPRFPFAATFSFVVIVCHYCFPFDAAKILHADIASCVSGAIWRFRVRFGAIWCFSPRSQGSLSAACGLFPPLFRRFSTAFPLSCTVTLPYHYRLTPCRFRALSRPARFLFCRTLTPCRFFPPVTLSCPAQFCRRLRGAFTFFSTYVIPPILGGLTVLNEHVPAQNPDTYPLKIHQITPAAQLREATNCVPQKRLRTNNA